ncbi:hypothetical protein [Candidatus Protochlamydia sp. W-9]|uniref:hypothetical protein n=1 Tax=Candidatus Protochlamydia sp. W-9 TaxID=1785087 RepID=UPI00096A67C5|nr:hypothetical protein [Candidatus Protochlamydia sp. W-9]
MIQGFYNTVVADVEYLKVFFQKNPEQRSFDLKVNLIALRFLSLGLMAVGVIRTYTALTSASPAIFRAVSGFFVFAIGHDLFVIGQNMTEDDENKFVGFTNTLMGSLRDLGHAFNGNSQRVVGGRVSILTRRTFFPSFWNCILQNSFSTNTQTSR